MNNKNQAFSMGRRWLIFSTVFVIGILAAYNMFKAPPLFSVIIPELGFTDENVGWVMSMFGIIGVVLAFPAGAILNKLGIKKSLIITAASLAIGSALGAVATNAGMLLASRVVEGIGMGLISVVGPAAIATIIPRAKQGLAMGLWAVWFPAGTVFAFNTAPALSAALGWRSVWWMAAVLSVAALVFAALCYAQPPAEKTAEEAGAPAAALRKPDMRSILLVAIGFMVWNMFNAGAIGGFYPTFLQTVHAMDPQTAGFVASITNICVLFLGPISGVVSDKLGTRKGLLVFAFAGAAAFLAFGFGNNLALIYVFLIGYSFFSASAATGTFSIIPELTHQPEKIGFSMAIVAFLQNIGIVVGSAVFPVLAASLAWDWNTASLMFCVPLAVVGLVCSIFVREKANKE
ncbi:MFS transporter [Gordonibacter sp.]|uniref:MFS transporter n=1 Tax=Gordonibacter sp. TaxID=1968902 RepID=UPI002FC5F2DB